ncbi:hypothetical protein L21SP5_00697 [Salinivirga cyanobacteriivorans]|uniref:Uncharacterized protein n=1 Tax=Salinivirga cyanobacteriivorans TaxID=1307839 RepID=A0A0S2HWD9_9BACT|nr:hypothetical protein [Salinivirga cyanobacteriivorans]ALO14369.1 hypothetical protein L21SP5_00697 [Salinivirga cyanobacteriivorans]
MGIRIIAAYLALCVGDRNIIDKLIKADTVRSFISENPSINDIVLGLLAEFLCSNRFSRKHKPQINQSV